MQIKLSWILLTLAGFFFGFGSLVLQLCSVVNRTLTSRHSRQACRCNICLHRTGAWNQNSLCLSLFQVSDAYWRTWEELSFFFCLQTGKWIERSREKRGRLLERWRNGSGRQAQSQAPAAGQNLWGWDCVSLLIHTSWFWTDASCPVCQCVCKNAFSCLICMRVLFVSVCWPWASFRHQSLRMWSVCVCAFIACIQSWMQIVIEIKSRIGCTVKCTSDCWNWFKCVCVCLSAWMCAYSYLSFPSLFVLFCRPPCSFSFSFFFFRQRMQTRPQTLLSSFTSMTGLACALSSFSLSWLFFLRLPSLIAKKC